MKFPALNQYKKWSLPSKLTFLGFIISVISFTVWILNPIYSSLISNYKTIKYTNNINELEDYVKNRDWESLGYKLISIDESQGNKDWYDYYSAIYSSKNENSFNTFKNPEFYLTKIETNSKYFDRSIIQLISSYLKIKNQDIFDQKFDALIKRLDNINYQNPEYFLVRLFSCKSSIDKNCLTNIYNLIKELYPKIFKVKAGTVEFNVNKVGIPRPIDTGKLSKLYGIAFVIIYQSYENKTLTKGMIKDSKIMFPNEEAYTFSEMGMSYLRIFEKKNKRKYLNFINRFNSENNK